MSNLPFNLEQLPFEPTTIGNFFMMFALVSLGITIFLALFLGINHIIWGIRLLVKKIKNDKPTQQLSKVSQASQLNIDTQSFIMVGFLITLLGVYLRNR